MRKLSLIILLFVGFMFQAGLAHAYTFNPGFIADGKLNEWGVTPGAFGASQWVPNAGIFYTEEDQSPNVSGGYLNPGYGGQAFDAEAMYAAYDSTNLYFAIVTGKTPGDTNGYRPGDIAFDFGKNGSYEYGIETTGSNSGKLYSVSSWHLSGWDHTTPTEMDQHGNSLGIGPLVYNQVEDANHHDIYLGDHYVIEGYIPISYFGSAWNQGFTMSWTETCGNDVIKLNVTPTPEPATMMLFGMGLAGLGVLRKRQFKA